jgi:hypothetical protein
MHESEPGHSGDSPGWLCFFWGNAEVAVFYPDASLPVPVKWR